MSGWRDLWAGPFVSPQVRVGGMHLSIIVLGTEGARDRPQQPISSPRLTLAVPRWSHPEPPSPPVHFLQRADLSLTRLGRGCPV